MIVRIRNAGEEREGDDQWNEPMITQKAHIKVCKEKDHQARVLYIERNQFRTLAEEEQKLLDIMNKKLKKQLNITYIVGGIAYLLGGVTSWLML